MNFRTQLAGLATAALLLGLCHRGSGCRRDLQLHRGRRRGWIRPGQHYGTVTVTENCGGLDFSFLPTSPLRIHDGNFQPQRLRLRPGRA
jgi:hypothetical protein